MELLGAFSTQVYPPQTMETFRDLNDVYYNRSDGEFFVLLDMLSDADLSRDAVKVPPLFENLFAAVPHGLFCTSDPEDFEEAVEELYKLAEILENNQQINDGNRIKFGAAALLYKEFKAESKRIDEGAVVLMIDNLEEDHSKRTCNLLLNFFLLAEKTDEKPSERDLKSALAEFLGTFFCV